MRITKKFIAVILALITAMSVFAVSASAVEAPTLSVSVVSETSTTAVLKVTLEKGYFNAINLDVNVSSNVKKCISFKGAKGYVDVFVDYSIDGDNQLAQSFNSDEMRFGVASTKPFNAKLDLLEKKSSAPLVDSDIDIYVESCSIGNDNAATGNKPTELSSSVKIQKIFNTFKLNDTSIDLNYKKKVLLSYESTYAPEALTWTSSDEKVATVDANGNVYASGTGNATITVTSADGRVNESCEVSVSYQWWEWIIIIVLFGWIWY